MVGPTQMTRKMHCAGSEPRVAIMPRKHGKELVQECVECGLNTHVVNLTFIGVLVEGT